MAEIQSISIKHEAIMDFLMGHPTVTLGDVAMHFGMTRGWLSQVIHSDVFQAKLREKQDVAFHHTVLPLREKMHLVAHQALDKLAEQLPFETETTAVNKVAENILEKLGFSSSKPAASVGGTGVTVNVHNSLRLEIEEAQKLLGKAEKPAVLEVVIDGERAPIALRSSPAPSVGAPSVSPALRERDAIEGEFTEAKTGS